MPFEIDVNRDGIGRVAFAPSHVARLPRPARDRRATDALTHQRVVRVFRHARERDGEELVHAAVAVRREDERLAVGRQLPIGLVPRALRDVVFLLGLDVVEIDLGVLLVVAPAVDEPVAVGRVLRDGEAAGAGLFASSRGAPPATSTSKTLLSAPYASFCEFGAHARLSFSAGCAVSFFRVAGATS